MGFMEVRQSSSCPWQSNCPLLTRRAVDGGGEREGLTILAFCCTSITNCTKNHKKPDPFSGSCRVQLVTRERALREAFNSTHVALPVQCGFEHFMRVGQLLWLVRLDKKKGGVRKKREVGTVKVPPSQIFSLYLHSYTEAIQSFSPFFWWLATCVCTCQGKRERVKWKSVTPSVSVFMKLYYWLLPHSKSSRDAAQRGLVSWWRWGGGETGRRDR